MTNFITYQLLIQLKTPLTLTSGKFSGKQLPEGYYVYTGSAKRGLRSRVLRHCLPKSTTFWHIDYLLANSEAQVISFRLSKVDECTQCQQLGGEIIIPGFGASDCSSQCNSHFRKITTKQAQENFSIWIDPSSQDQATEYKKLFGELTTVLNNG